VDGLRREKIVITVVSGLPRSGTSLMMQILVAGGMTALTDGLREADEDNPRGYFEFEPVKRLRADTSWVPLAEGKVVKVIHLLLPALPRDGTYQVLLMRRPLDQVLASQAAMLRRQGKPAGNPGVLRTAFAAQMSETERFLSATPGFRYMAVDYERLLRPGVGLFQHIALFLNRALAVDRMAACVEPGMQRQRSSQPG
jgi:hypothetical protein